MKTVIVGMFAMASWMIGGDASAMDMPPLAKKNNCNACHAIDRRMFGPAWMDVAKAYNRVGATGSAVDPAKYKVSRKVADILAENQAKTAEEWLIRKVSKGGGGNWGESDMQDDNAPAVKAEDIKELVRFILGLDK